MEELRRCPFCGGESEEVYAMHDRNTNGICCRDCQGNVDGFDSSSEARVAWNTRCEDPLIKKLQADLKMMEAALEDCERNDQT